MIRNVDLGKFDIREWDLSTETPETISWVWHQLMGEKTAKDVGGKMNLPPHGKENFARHGKQFFTQHGKEFFTWRGKEFFTS